MVFDQPEYSLLIRASTYHKYNQLVDISGENSSIRIGVILL